LEKDLTLDVVQRLGMLLETRMGAEVIYTRKDDTYVALERRAEMANERHADLFVSVHANYSSLPSARGVETYYTDTFSSANAHSHDGKAVLQGVSFAMVDIRTKVRDSHSFAASLQRALYGSLASRNPGLQNRGVKQAAYVVLTGTTMPAVLTEVSFVSSLADEEHLQDEAYRQQIAQALYKGIAGFADKKASVVAKK
jgi:N-acetylmuramoyl-L-alanine amidase